VLEGAVVVVVVVVATSGETATLKSWQVADRQTRYSRVAEEGRV